MSLTYAHRSVHASLSSIFITILKYVFPAKPDHLFRFVEKLGTPIQNSELYTRRVSTGPKENGRRGRDVVALSSKQQSLRPFSPIEFEDELGLGFGLRLRLELRLVSW